jgi:hypothetical protein
MVVVISCNNTYYVFKVRVLVLMRVMRYLQPIII